MFIDSCQGLWLERGEGEGRRGKGVGIGGKGEGRRGRAEGGGRGNYMHYWVPK